MEATIYLLRAMFGVYCFSQFLPSLGRSPLSSIGRPWFSGSSRNTLTPQDSNTSIMTEIVTDFKLIIFALFFM